MMNDFATKDFIFPASYVDPKTKRLHPKFWVSQDGRMKRRFFAAQKAVGFHRAFFAYTPHLVRIHRGTCDDPPPPGATTWEEAMGWMADHAHAPWYFWVIGKGADVEAGSYIGFANRNDAVHFALWYRFS